MKFSPVLELIVPVVAIFVCFRISDAEFTEEFFARIKNNQSTTQIAVQIVSHVLAMLQVSSVCGMLNLSARFRSLSRPSSLQDLSLWTALTGPRVDHSLPPLYFAVTLAFIAITFLPGALWAGTLSPLFVLETRQIGQQMVPAYTLRTKALWDSQFQIRESWVWNINDNCLVPNNAKRLVPSCPVPTLQGPLLLSAASATTLDGKARKHPKIDNPNWEYNGRSFGVGSSVDLANNTISDDRVLSYNYTEFGYMANVSCIKNSSSDFHFRLIDYMNRTITASQYQQAHHPELDFNHSLPTIHSQLSIYYAEGYLPNSMMGVPEMYPVISWHENYENMSAWATVANDNRNMIAIAAGAHMYQALNQTQCEVFFNPTIFDIAVSRTNHSITVLPQRSLSARLIDPTGHLPTNVIHSINLLSRMSPSLYVSVLGETLNRNVERMQKQQPHLAKSEAVTTAVAESFTVMIDDILLAYGASQILNAGDFTSTDTIGVIEVVKIGQPLYRNLVFGLNCLIALLIAFEAARTKGWHLLTEFNTLDFKNILIAASAGGRGIALSVSDDHLVHGTKWRGDPKDPVVRRTRVKWDLHATLAGTETVAMVEAEGYRKRERDSGERSFNLLGSGTF